MDQSFRDRLTAWSQRVEYLRKHGSEIYDSRKKLVRNIDKNVPLCVVVESGISNKSREWENQQRDIWRALEIEVQQPSDVSMHLVKLEKKILDLVV